ncbi:MAG: DUF4058 family protein [Okeania sp. SIO3I5]|uniref:DUF4058 family protein n=1 Tax=Okeania sp. SIO3I5 TaxID=2607805 RepID=UPI0013B87C33|nr:DUF4058 family protein [Okeania sp. SIO3I5]NEQ36567.1 DUF4058 family protein [Okeania sp. SIO3I5]
MPSPFPGMDPYLEGYLWPDVHNALANKIRQQLTPQLRPRYAARLEVYVVEDNFPESEVGILYPDVEVMQLRQPKTTNITPGTATALTPPLSLPIFQPVPVRLSNVQIRDTAQNILVTSIEVLSPVNKREPGLKKYSQKRRGLYEAGVHLVEIDFLRRGTRPFAHPQMPEVAYAVALTRSHANVMDVWPLKLPDLLPTIPIPLRSPDPDVVLNLSAALNEIYDEAAYDLSINYQEVPPPPVLSKEERGWIESVLGSY